MITPALSRNISFLISLALSGGCSTSGTRAAAPAPADPATKRATCHQVAATVGQFQIKASRSAVSATRDLVAETAEAAAALADELARLRFAGADISRAQQQLRQMQLLLEQANQRLQRARTLPERIERARPAVIRRCMVQLPVAELNCLRDIDFGSVTMPWDGDYEGLEQASKTIAACTPPARFGRVFAAPQVAPAGE